MEDQSGSSTIKIEKLNDTNFYAWKRKIQLVLAFRDLDQYIDDDRPNDEIAQKTWDKGDRKAQAVIGLSLSDEHLEHVAEAQTAKEMWETIMNVFQRHTLLNKLAARRNFYTATMKEGEKALLFINRVQHLASILKSMGVDVDDQETAMAVLNGLPPRYDSLIVALDALGNEDRLFTLDFVKSRLLQEEQRSNMRELEEVSRPNAALFNRSQNIGKTRSSYHCTNCGRNGHTAQRCWGKDINGRRPNPPPGYRSSGNNGQRRGGNQAGSSNLNLAMVGQSSDASTATDDNKSEETCLMTKVVNSGDIARSSWIADSACTAHMTYDRSSFAKYNSVSGASVEMGTRAKTEVVGSGDIVITLSADGHSEKCRLKDVLHVPEFEYSLLSISTLDRRGIATTFGNGKFVMRKGTRVVGTGKLVGSLYVLDTVEPKKHFTHKANVATLKLWHERLAHVNSKGIAEMARKNVVKGLKYEGSDKTDVCAPCIHGKLPRTVIPRERSSDRSTELLHLVHSDVCGPLETRSLAGSRYFITFKDDRSSWLVTYPMSRKSEAFSKYKSFKAMAERQTGRKLRILRSDRGGEYLSNEFADALDKDGVKHELSTAETPQQNGVAERVNRTLMDLVRSMLHAKGLPKVFWAEALATAVYIRNRVTSRSIEKGTTPFHHWHGNTPNLAHIRVFGCRCWYGVQKSKLKKLDSRAREAVLIGYADKSKAYKLWDPELKKVIVSRDVVFAEDESSKNVKMVGFTGVDPTIENDETVV